jgi:transketolase
MEANVIGTAAGLSLTGRKPFVHTFTAFASRRCFDQLFMSLDYQRNNVKVIASDAGVTACHNGGTHMSFEDMGIVRGLAHSVVLEVTDAVMFEDILRQLIDLDGFTGYARSANRRRASTRRVRRLPSAKVMCCAKATISP